MMAMKDQGRYRHIVEQIDADILSAGKNKIDCWFVQLKKRIGTKILDLHKTKEMQEKINVISIFHCIFNNISRSDS